MFLLVYFAVVVVANVGADFCVGFISNISLDYFLITHSAVACFVLLLLPIVLALVLDAYFVRRY